MAPSFAANDTYDATPQYAVLPDQGSKANDATESKSPQKWKVDAFSEDFLPKATVAGQTTLTFNAVITRAGGSGATVSGGAPDLVRGCFRRVHDRRNLHPICHRPWGYPKTAAGVLRSQACHGLAPASALRRRRGSGREPGKSTSRSPASTATPSFSAMR